MRLKLLLLAAPASYVSGLVLLAAVPDSDQSEFEGPGGSANAAVCFVEQIQVAVAANQPTQDRHTRNTAGHFTGLVKGPDGSPLAGAKIFIVSNKGDAGDIGPVRATTDAGGRFEFDAPDMTYRGYDGVPLRREGLVFAIADGFAPDWMETWGHNTSRLREYWTPVQGAGIELQLAVDDVPVQGRFLDVDGRPLAGARVQLTRLMIPRGCDLTEHLARWSKASIASGFLTKVPDYKRELGRVQWLPEQVTETVTGADGRFKLNGFGRDRLVRLAVSAPSVVNTTLEVMTRDSPNVGTFVDFKGKPTQTVYGAKFTLQLKPGLTVKGVVRDRDTMAPVSGMWVAQYDNPLTHPARRDGVPVTDESGRFTITGLDPALLGYEAKHRMLTAIPQPGVKYLQARRAIQPDVDLVIECVRGIPYRLALTDEDGRPVEGIVEYRTVNPNLLSKDLVEPLLTHTNWPVMNRGLRQDDGTYEGFALPGPGAVLIKMPDRRNYRPAFVDPAVFFERDGRKGRDQPGDAYAAPGTLDVYGGRYDQTDYNAIVLVNPPPDADDPLELAATVYRDRPRPVSLVDPKGHPVVEVDSRMQWPTRETKEVLRNASFFVKGLHPQLGKQMTFIKQERQLIGLLLARLDDESSYTVQMQPWGTVTGRVVDHDGQPLPKKWVAVRVTNDGIRKFRSGLTDKDGRFAIPQVIPGLNYALGDLNRGPGFVFTDGRPTESLTLSAGEVRDIGDVRLLPTAN